MVIEGDDMEKSILKFETMTDTDLLESRGLSPSYPCAVGFVKGFVYTEWSYLITSSTLFR